ncbi:hypothetical protein GIS00_16355 [Nakamurella sp. YIM 132087]|uniref:Uncharacterized protein n=1 Tax=Nakamurella alba TaxID=2665158 RepID=A0A7K1FQ78_9ACTN|nr:hypothetical protein [Nakamurella alba]MTD15509.1 hypothetical protein [Nakamurella alba]
MTAITGTRMLWVVVIACVAVGLTSCATRMPSGAADGSGPQSAPRSAPDLPVPTLDTSGVVATTWATGIGVSEAAPLTEISAPTLPELIARIGWGHDGEILLVTWGSSFCPTLPIEVTVTSPTSLSIDVRMVAPPDDGGPAACTADLAPTTSAIPTPAGLAIDQPIDVTVGGTVDMVLPAR